MKKFVALLTLVLVLMAPCIALTEASQRTIFDDPFLDIPWSITSEEFIEFTQNNLNLTFVPTSEEPLCLQLDQPEAWRFWDEPVQAVTAYCMPMDYYATGTLAVSLPALGIDRKDSYECITIDFAPRPGEISLENRLAQFASLFAECQAQFGEMDWPRMHGQFLPDKLDPTIPFYEQMEGDSYSLPMNDGVFQQDIALKMLNRPYDSIILSAHFRNHAIMFRYEPFNTQAPITVRFFAVFYYSVDTSLRQYASSFPSFPSSN